ncbi:MAG: hypothetical protein ACTHK1_11360 [Actinomycetales bacterium]
MRTPLRRPRVWIAATAATTLVAGGIATSAILQEQRSERLPWKAHELFEQMKGEKDFAESSAGTANGGSGGEAFEAKTATEQFDQHRGIVPPGGYSTALGQINALGKTTFTGRTWDERTKLPYNADDENYRDYFSNSSGGSGYVTGRITGIAVDGNGYVFAGGADGGVWRRAPKSNTWQPIADQLGTLSTGDLEIGPDGALWYATGEGNTGGTAYVGQGVYRLVNPDSSTFDPNRDRVGGIELESTVIQKIRFADGKAFVASSRGIWSHTVSDTDSTWTLNYAPNPSYLPGGSDAADPAAGYKNIVNDVLASPNDPTHLIAALGWRSGDTYNGFYESTNSGKTWTKVNLQGGIDSIDPSDVGQATLAYSADGSKLYAVVQSVALLNKATGTVNSYLKGVYVSNSGNVAGPWTKIADSTKLANSGSALKQSVGGKGYGPGIQSWYNQFVTVDPSNPKHVYVGLEEVYETKDGGATWTTPGPYWNFYFGCWDYTKPNTHVGDSIFGPAATVANCPTTTHSDQHSVAIGTVDGTATLFVGNDGGIFSRPVKGAANADGHATDWTSLNDGTIDALQYYAVGVGPEPAGSRGTTGAEIISGGLQDNGGSIRRVGTKPETMSSNFGGDGGDVLVDPDNGCNIVQEYVYLSMRVTNKCAETPLKEDGTYSDGFVNTDHANTRDIAPPDVNARFIAPFDADRTPSLKDNWIAAGQHVWFQDEGFDITDGSKWQNKLDLGSGKVATAVAMNNKHAVVAWCGSCGEAFNGGLKYTNDITAATPKWVDLGTSTDVAARYIGGVSVTADGTVYAVNGGFSRRFTDGPGANVKHVWRFASGSSTGEALDGTTFPDVPSNSVKLDGAGDVIVGTDLGVFVLPSKANSGWQELASGLPRTTVMDVEIWNGKVYAATHGRGIWSVDLGSTAPVAKKRK